MQSSGRYPARFARSRETLAAVKWAFIQRKSRHLSKQSAAAVDCLPAREILNEGQDDAFASPASGAADRLYEAARAAGDFGDPAILCLDDAARRGVGVERVELSDRHLAVRAARPVLVNDVEQRKHTGARLFLASHRVDRIILGGCCRVARPLALGSPLLATLLLFFMLLLLCPLTVAAPQIVIGFEGHELSFVSGGNKGVVSAPGVNRSADLDRFQVFSRAFAALCVTLFLV